MIDFNSEDYLFGKAVGIESAMSMIDADSRVAFSAGDDHKANILRRVAGNLRIRAKQAREVAEKAEKAKKPAV